MNHYFKEHILFDRLAHIKGITFFDINNLNTHFVSYKFEMDDLYAIFHIWNKSEYSFFGFGIKENFITANGMSHIAIPFYNIESILNSDKVSQNSKNIILFNLDIFGESFYVG